MNYELGVISVPSDNKIFLFIFFFYKNVGFFLYIKHLLILKEYYVHVGFEPPSFGIKSNTLLTAPSISLVQNQFDTVQKVNIIF